MKLSLAPDASDVIKLLKAANLPTSDITPELLSHFVGAQSEHSLEGAVGYEAYGLAGLLRSLVVAPGVRGLGLGTTLVAAIEKLASENGVEHLFLLTTDAEGYFEHHGYSAVDRETVPNSIRTTTQFSSLCPGNATVMVKAL